MTFRDRWLREFFITGEAARRVPADLQRALLRKLQMLDDAATEADLRSPPGNHLERLAGALRGWQSIRVNAQWRLIFHWNHTRCEAEDVYLDSHSYRTGGRQ